MHKLSRLLRLCALISLVQPIAAQNTPACNSGVNVALGNDCSAAPGIGVLATNASSNPNLVGEVDRNWLDNAGIWEPLVFDASDAGETYQFRVRDTLTGNSCTGLISLQDNTPPVISCPPNLTISALFETPTPEFLRDSLGYTDVFATAVDACEGPVEVEYATNIAVIGNCDSVFDVQLRRRWYVGPSNAPQASCLQWIFQPGPLLSEMVFPADTSSTECSASALWPGETGVPYIVAHGKVIPFAPYQNPTFFGVSARDSLSGTCDSVVRLRIWHVFSWCGEEVEYAQRIRYPNASAPPSLICPAQQIVYNLASDCTAKLWLSALQFDNICAPVNEARVIWEDGMGGYDTLEVGNTLESGFGPPTQPIIPTGLVQNFPLGSTTLRYEVSDVCGNFVACSAVVYVFDSTGLCPDGDLPSIWARARTDQGQPIRNVQVTRSNNIPPFNNTQTTDSTGVVTFSPQPNLSDFGLQFAKADDPLNGVSTFDILLISKHILNIEPLPSPYKMLAADANQSGSISTSDIVAIRRLLLGITNNFPNNTVWRFARANFVFPNPANPFLSPFPGFANDTLPYTTPILDTIGAIGIKLGDVNGSALTDALPQADERDARPGSVFLELPDQELAAGAVVEIPIFASRQLEGFQGSFSVENAEIIDFEAISGISDEHFSLSPDKNTLLVACDQAGIAHFSLKIRSLREARLRDMLSLKKAPLKAEAYTQEPGGPLQSTGLALRFHPDKTMGMQLYQNQPNPARERTDIPCYLPDAGQTSLEILDATGRLLHTQTAWLPAGPQVIQVSLKNVPKGLLFYRLRSGAASLARKMYYGG
jgi:hypothetical protein